MFSSTAIKSNFLHSSLQSCKWINLLTVAVVAVLITGVRAHLASSRVAASSKIARDKHSHQGDVIHFLFGDYSDVFDVAAAAQDVFARRLRDETRGHVNRAQLRVASDQRAQLLVVYGGLVDVEHLQVCAPLRHCVEERALLKQSLRER